MSDLDLNAIGNAAAIITRMTDRQSVVESDGSVNRLASMKENLSAAGDQFKSMYTADGYDFFHSRIPEGSSKLTRVAYDAAGIAVDVADLMFRPVLATKQLADVALHGLALAFGDKE